MKSTTNVFQEGLRTDLHPLSTSQQYLTDALNATMITYNGNEMMLQNDMGNTLIQDAATGNIMGLSPGFIPVGMKEHGGIMYIASVNKEGDGEIGTIPSPIIRDLYKDKVSLSIKKNIPIDSGDPIQITNKLYPADKFITNLQMSVDNLSTLKGIPHRKKSKLSPWEGDPVDPCDIILERQICKAFRDSGKAESTSIYSPVISYADDSQDNIEIENADTPVNVLKKGLYNLNLYSFPEQGKAIMASNSLLSSQPYEDGDDLKKSQYWFLHTNSPTSVFPKDLLNATLNKDLKQVPVSNKPGELAVKLIPETITDFGMLPRAKEPYNTPITYKTTEGQYYTYFPGFYYTSDNGLYVEKLTARVIDESTNRSVNLEYPYGEEVLFDRYDLNDLYRTDAYNGHENAFFNGGLKFWKIPNDELGLPHARSNAASNTYILSPIAGLFNHEKTSFKSSTQGKDDSPHSGVFRAVLGDKYQNWYRLEVDYEDQYGGNKKTFTTRFNPYLNDVFGTNLSVDNLEKTTSLTIGQDNHQLEHTCVHPTSLQLNQLGVYANRHPFYSMDFDQWENVGETVSSCQKQFVYSQQKFIQLYADQQPPLNISYFYDAQAIPIDFSTLKALKVQNSYIDGTAGRVTLNKIEIQKFQGMSAGSNQTMQQFYVGGNKDYYGTLSELTIKTTLDSFSCGEQTRTQTIGIEYFLDDPGYTISLRAPIQFENVDMNISITERQSDLHYLNIDLPNIIVNRGPLRVGTTELYESLYQNRRNKPIYKYAFEKRSSQYLHITPQSIPIEFIYKATCTYQPKYQITPYFLLSGKNPEKVYVQRFNNLTFEHNFEDVNYISEGTLNTVSSQISPCSYSEQNPFYYTSDKFTQRDTTLDSGVYVLNIQRCPGMGNWTQSSNTPVINLQITIGENTYSYNPEGGDKTIKNWSVNALDTNGYTYKTDYANKSGDTSNMRIYTPIVLVIPQATNITINIIPKDGWKFNRQSIGLYKIREVEADGIMNELQVGESIYLYQDYMKLIQTKASNLDPVEQYHFIQKYGVFFKEAFVFVDGLYKDDKVNSITIGEKTYQPYPYIPSDPSILPVQLGTDNNYYWNTYYMPEEVLNSDDCNFIFSNADGVAIIDNDELFKSVKSGNLRQLITQE